MYPYDYCQHAVENGPQRYFLDAVSWTDASLRARNPAASGRRLPKRMHSLRLNSSNPHRSTFGWLVCWWVDGVVKLSMQHVVPSYYQQWCEYVRIPAISPLFELWLSSKWFERKACNPVQCLSLDSLMTSISTKNLKVEVELSFRRED